MMMRRRMMTIRIDTIPSRQYVAITLAGSALRKVETSAK